MKYNRNHKEEKVDSAIEKLVLMLSHQKPIPFKHDPIIWNNVRVARFKEHYDPSLNIL
jgi:hypothetical protein